jgi:hypothetical protein
MDFLQGRTFYVEVEGEQSCRKFLDRGCVQGSVLGPRLFSLYVAGLENELKDMINPANEEGKGELEVISYADDSYVIVSSNSPQETKLLAERTMDRHVAFLKNLGMVVNETKTEIMWIGESGNPGDTIRVSDQECRTVGSMKALGIYIDSKLTWDIQAEASVKKGTRLLSVFRFLRKYMTESQFLKAVTANYYGAVFYGSSVWLSNCKTSFKTKFSSLHFRILRSACKDYHFKLSHLQLAQRCGRASPKEWAQYTTASLAIKVMRDKKPKPLYDVLKQTFYTERRNKGRGLFFDASRRRVGRQSLQNRLEHVAQIKEPWNEQGQVLTNDRIRVMLKKAFFSYNVIGTVINTPP